MTDEEEPRPRVVAPEGAVDCHVEIHGPAARFPPRPGRRALPERPVEAYREVQERLRTARLVLVQPDVYGTDTRCLLAALEEATKSLDGSRDGCARGLAAVAAEAEAAELLDLGQAGIVGAVLRQQPDRRLYDWQTADRLAWRLADLGWLSALEIDGADLHEVEQAVRAWPGRTVIQHGGLFRGAPGPREPGFKALTRLIDRGRVWVSLSAPYLGSTRGRANDPAVADRARALIDWAPERMVWGSGWPHAAAEAPPDDGALLDMVREWAGTETTWRRLLVENAETLFGFAPWSSAAEPDRRPGEPPSPTSQ